MVQPAGAPALVRFSSRQPERSSGPSPMLSSSAYSPPAWGTVATARTSVSTGRGGGPATVRKVAVKVRRRPSGSNTGRPSSSRRVAASSSTQSRPAPSGARGRSASQRPAGSREASAGTASGPGSRPASRALATAWASRARQRTSGQGSPASGGATGPVNSTRAPASSGTASPDGAHAETRVSRSGGGGPQPAAAARSSAAAR